MVSSVLPVPLGSHLISSLPKPPPKAWKLLTSHVDPRFLETRRCVVRPGSGLGGGATSHTTTTPCRRNELQVYLQKLLGTSHADRDRVAVLRCCCVTVHGGRGRTVACCPCQASHEWRATRTSDAFLASSKARLAPAYKRQDTPNLSPSR